MIKRVIPLTFLSWSCILLAAAGLAAQDFQRSYQLRESGYVRIRNISGDVSVNGYSGETVLVTAYKEGRDRDRVEIEDRSSEDRVDILVRYPESGSTDASVNFEVRIPESLALNLEGISSVSGNVEIAGVTGRIKADSVSGDVTVTGVVGTVSASAVSGDVLVEITRLEGVRDMKFTSVSGNVQVRAPAELDAYVEMSTVSGSLKTNFDIEVLERRYGPGRSARGRLGSGQCNLRITSVSGRVSLLRN